MKLRVLQNWKGEQDNKHYFELAITNGENRMPIQDEKGIKAVLYYADEESHYQFESPFEYIEDIFNICYKDRDQYITHRYHEQAIFFLKTFNENIEELNKNALADYKAEMEGLIKEYERKLATAKNNLEIDELIGERILPATIVKSNKIYQGFVDKETQVLEDLKEGSESHTKKLLQIQGYKDKIYTWQP